jgi:hypothetical protein
LISNCHILRFKPITLLDSPTAERKIFNMPKNIMDNLKKLAKKNGALKVQVAGDKNNTPDAYQYNGTRKNFIPDMAVTFEDRVDLFSIENSVAKKHLPEMILKWILFSLEARKKGGDFYIAVVKDKEAVFNEIIASKMISAEVITF